ncbi:MAG TPA: winged helix DNA-binding domain-containing protein [Puia sp.]
MNSHEIAQIRLINQHLARPAATPDQLVRWMGCIQAQDYAMAKWAVGIRLPKATDANIEKAFNEGRILRTHALRPTWHFVCPEDIRWMLRFNAPKVRALSRLNHQQLGIDAAILKKSRTLIAKAIADQGPLTRPQLAEALRKGKIATNETRLGHLLMEAELDAILCSAGRIGKQFAYGLLDELVSGSGHARTMSRTMSNEEAIAELAHRYFPSRGPATVRDFAWWGGLTLTEARKGHEAVQTGMDCIKAHGQEYWFRPPTHTAGPATTYRPATTYLLPAFDEYTVAYKDRSDVLDPAHAAMSFHGLKPILVQNTHVAGIWQRTMKKGMAVVETMPFEKPVAERTLRTAIRDYQNFIGGQN